MISPTRSNDLRSLVRRSLCSPPLCDVQDSLLEITLRSRVIEKLSVALDVCLFQHERDPRAAINRVDEVSFLIYIEGTGLTSMYRK